ncbi:peptide deformylase [candidate division WOR-3 bacterium]|nr:peptide deformylase [candidate division WOR-3 bacterium]
MAHRSKAEGPTGTNRRVVLYGNPALRTRSRPVEKLTPELVQFLQDLKVSMLTQDGLGLAANQLAVTVAAFAINPAGADVDQEPYCIINPQTVATEGTVEAEEGCLSLPGLFDFLPRPEFARITGLNEELQPITVEGTARLLTRALLHEIDHLNGVLFIDHLGPTRRGMFSTKLKELEAMEKEQCK